MKFTAAVALSLAAVAAAKPIPATPIIEAIAPESKSCDGAEDPSTCTTAADLAGPLVTALITYGIYTPARIAAVVSNMALESGQFKFNHNVYPGRPGQGTANMQMANFNLEFAKTIPELATKYGKFATDAAMTDDQKKQMVKDLNDPKYNFATGAWYFDTHCSDEVKNLLDSDPDAGFKLFITDCLDTTEAPERTQFWVAAKKAFGI